MDEPKIEKETRPALFELSDGSEMEGEVFLRLHEAHHTGRQKLGDLLNGDSPFIPVKTNGNILLLNRSHIVLGKAESEWEEDDLMTLGKQHAIWVKMVNGEEIQGKIFVNISEVAFRVKDYFNQPDDFLPLMQPEWIVYINRKFVLSVHD